MSLGLFPTKLPVIWEERIDHTFVFAKESGMGDYAILQQSRAIFLFLKWFVPTCQSQGSSCDARVTAADMSTSAFMSDMYS